MSKNIYQKGTIKICERKLPLITLAQAPLLDTGQHRFVKMWDAKGWNTTEVFIRVNDCFCIINGRRVFDPFAQLGIILIDMSGPGADINSLEAGAVYCSANMGTSRIFTRTQSFAFYTSFQFAQQPTLNPTLIRYFTVSPQIISKEV